MDMGVSFIGLDTDTSEYFSQYIKDIFYLLPKQTKRYGKANGVNINKLLK
jgi:hypothetical protein